MNELARLRRILLSDKARLPCGFEEALRGDAERMLSQYFRLLGKTQVIVDVDERGIYRVSIAAAADGIYPCKKPNE